MEGDAREQADVVSKAMLIYRYWERPSVRVRVWGKEEEEDSNDEDHDDSGSEYESSGEEGDGGAEGE